MSKFGFEIIKRCGNARLGVLQTPHGSVETPCFMPVGTQATVKALTPAQIKETGAGIILANTYHLYLRPGHELVREAGGLHRFMCYDGPILTDSGGFQVFSLSGLNKIEEDGVRFASHIDGSRHFFTPVSVTAVQEALGADIIMAFDECAPYPCEREYAKKAMERTHRWAERCKNAKTRDDQALFGIVQGSVYTDLRIESAKAISSMDFDGNAIGGLSVGEPKELMYETLDGFMEYMPENKPRYLMGVGSPDCLVEGVMRGIDMFDCVLQTRSARNALAFTFSGKMNMLNAKYERDFSPVEADCDCYACANFSRAYIRHLFKAKEILAATLLTMHNIRFTLRLMERLREAIRRGDLAETAKELLPNFQ